MSERDLILAHLALQREARDAERRSNRPGAKRTAEKREADREEARVARQRLEDFEDDIIGEGWRQRPARQVAREMADALEAVGVL